jgi:hypothetical protein
MHGVGVGGGMHGDRLDAELLAGAQHAKGDLAAVGDQDFLEHAPVFPALFDHDERHAVFDRLRILDENRLDRAGSAAPGSGSSSSWLR